MKAVLVAMGTIAGALGWGYWHSATHASLAIRVEDHGLRTSSQLYGTPQGVALTFFDAGGKALASARSSGPDGYIPATHPDPGIGDCSQYQQRAYATCYRAHSAWAADWALQVRTAHVAIGNCALRQVPVHVYSSNADWWLWWVPLPHVGGTPRRYVELVVKVDTRSCTAAG
jgi:hypothetical protein